MLHTNRLLQSTSPYLLQHAHNPVDWYEWGTEALAKAKQEDKPILLSIGYSSCHWCHVMAHQSFEDEDIAAIMNEHFVCIKLDREERPDIDHIYMEAVQAMGQNGGWPLNVFLTPTQKPFFGGTYFPPKNWAQLLIQISKAFKEKRIDIEQSADELGTHLNVSDLQRFQKAEAPVQPSIAKNMLATLQKRFDFTWGGIDKAPKFIMPSTWLLLLRCHQLTREPQALEMLHLTLKRIAQGGIYDQIGGGFARYSVDSEWFAPHFEKMLYDNGQLLTLYAEAFQLSRDPEYKSTIYQTVAWLEREMMHPEGGFYSALDADSEGEEGKFYTWTWQELNEALGDDVEVAAEFYQIDETGNWEHGKNILIRSDETFVDATMAGRIHEINQKLF
ncbi:MAG: thioredoxin domain-containing protein, partial [Flammeovirgaceae bacterium]|nr:thioredoxin domain-containing protein [Flammeovirgaceae bacterium]